MSDVTVLPACEALAFLRRIESGEEEADPENGARWLEDGHKVIPLRFKSGWELRVFKDGWGGLEDWDYVDAVVAPDGREHDSVPLFRPYDDDPPERLAEWKEYVESGAGEVHNWTWRNATRTAIGCGGVAETLPRMISTEEALRMLHEMAERMDRVNVKRFLCLTPAGLPEEM